MTWHSLRESVEAVRPRSLGASTVEKGVILDELCRTTGDHRNAAMRRLRRVWEASDRACGKRLAPFLPELVAALERPGELRLAPAVREALRRLSAATSDRLLAPARGREPRRSHSQTRANSALQALVPGRTFGEWAGVRPGACQADLVAQCGETAEGLSRTTLGVVDVATSWAELEASRGKGQQRVGTGRHRARQRLPMGRRELHCDNGGECLNQGLAPWCQREGIRVTRGRPDKKNDQASVEQKTGGVGLRWVGADRSSSQAAYAQLPRVDRPRRDDVNCFQPVQKLLGKERVGAKGKKHYDRAQTPDQRLLAAGVLDEAQRAALRARYERLTPVTLRAAIDQALAALWELAERPRAGRAEPKATPEDQPAATADIGEPLF